MSDDDEAAIKQELDDWTFSTEKATPLHIGPCEVVVNDERYVRETTLFAAMERAEALLRERDEAHQWCVDEAEKHDVTKVALAKERRRVALLEEALRGIAAMEASGYESVNSSLFGKAQSIAAAALAGVEQASE